MKLSILLISLISFSSQLKGQDRSINYNGWYYLLGEFDVSQRLTVGLENHFRRSQILLSWQQILSRPYLTYKFNQSISTSIGYTQISNYPYGQDTNNLVFHEWNLWEQFLLKHKVGVAKLSHRLRLEERWIENDHLNIDGNISYLTGIQKKRLRYRITSILPIAKVGSRFKFSVDLFNEIWLNLSKSHLYNQNWSFLALGILPKPTIKIQIGYLIQHSPAVSHRLKEMNHTLQVGLKYNIQKKNNGNNRD